MPTLLMQLDQLLRGESTRLELLRRGSIDISPGGIALMSLPLSFFSGICMGVFSLTGSGSLARMQIIASALKMPALFFLTFVVTFPSLYVFNALVGSRLRLYSVLKLLVAAIGIMLTVLASLGPIVAFFAVTTTSYAFMKLLNVAVFTIAGVMGGGFLLRTLHRLNLASEDTPGLESSPSEPALPAPAASPGAPRALPAEPGANVRNLFRIWVGVFALVGAQMAWILRPFIGDPEQPFQWFRPVTSNFFEAVWRAFQSLF